MNCKKLLLHIRIVTVACLTASFVVFALCTSPLSAAPQEKEESMILQYGPDPNLFVRENVEAVIRGWEWQAELSVKQQELVKRMKTDWETKLKVIQEQTARLQEKMASADLAYPVDIRAVQNIEEEIRVLQGEIVGLNAELKQVKQDTELTAAELKFEKKSREAEIKLAKARLASVIQEYNNVQQLYKNSAVSKADLEKLKARVLELEVTLQTEQTKLQMLEARLASDLSGTLKAVAEKERMVRNRLNELIAKKKAIEDLQPIQKIAALEAEAEMARQMIEMAQVKQFELELENTRNLALIELATEKMEAEENPQKSKDDQ